MARTCEASSSSTDVSGARAAAPPTALLTVRAVLDRRVRRLGRYGEVLFGGEPFRLIRLSPAGAQVLDELSSGEAVSAPAPVALARRLVMAGILHPIPAERSVAPEDVTVVVPVRDDDAAAATLLRHLRADFAGKVVVVDDGSDTPSSKRLAHAAAATGATLVQKAEWGGPASARNAARPLTHTPLVAFLDADTLPAAGWLDRLVGHFDDATVGAVAPRVRTAGSGALARYESVASPLDLGAEPGVVGAHRRISYVPSAALVCRREALEHLLWFDPDLKVGEDVDLVRRLEWAGWTVRYEPRSVVHHDSRRETISFVQQRFSYGTSAADLERRHPGTVAPFEANRWALGAVLATVAVAVAVRRRRGSPFLAAATWVGLTAVPARSLTSKLRNLGVDRPTTAAVSAVHRGQAWTLAGLATALRRVWWPPALAAAVMMPRLRRPLAGALVTAELAGRLPLLVRTGKGARSIPSTLAYGALDDLAYGAGVWTGCLRQRSIRAVLPRVGQRPEDLAKPSRSR